MEDSEKERKRETGHTGYTMVRERCEKKLKMKKRKISDFVCHKKNLNGGDDIKFTQCN